LVANGQLIGGANFRLAASVVSNFKMVSDRQAEEARDHGMPCLVKGSVAKVFIAQGLSQPRCHDAPPVP
jgi:hypothetical protein